VEQMINSEKLQEKINLRERSTNKKVVNKRMKIKIMVIKIMRKEEEELVVKALVDSLEEIIKEVVVTETMTTTDNKMEVNTATKEVVELVVTKIKGSKEDREITRRILNNKRSMLIIQMNKTTIKKTQLQTMIKRLKQQVLVLVEQHRVHLRQIQLPQMRMVHRKLLVQPRQILL
jgi:hypothetical protein